MPVTKYCLSRQLCDARINELKGAVCDPKVVEAFNRAYHAGEFDLEKKQTAAQEAGQPMETV